MHRILHRSDGTKRPVHLGGWKKQPFDARDEAYRLKLHPALLAIPASTDNRPLCSAVEDQGDLGSCTAHMFAGLIESNEIRAHKAHSQAAAIPLPLAGATLPAPSAALPTVTVTDIAQTASGLTYKTSVTVPAPPAPPAPSPAPSPSPAKLIRVGRLFEYYATRLIEGTVSDDSGATIRDAIKAGSKYGVSDEAGWPYDVSKFLQKPPQPVWNAALTHKVTSYHAVADGDLATLRSSLALGYLIGFGFSVYDAMLSAETAQSGLLCRPGPDEQLQGGHAVCLAGYDDHKAMPDGSKGAFLVRNSWGSSWGLSGYFWMAYNYVGDTTLSSDFWIVLSSPI